MKRCEFAISAVVVFLLACGGGSSATPATEAAEPASEAKEKKADEPAEPAPEPGMADEDRIPPKPKPFISVSSLLRSGHASAHTPTVAVSTTEADRVIARVVQMFVELGEGMKSAGQDCDAVAAAVREWTKRHIAEFRKLMPIVLSIDKNMTPEREKEIEKQLAPAAQNMQAAMTHCKDHEAVRAAFMELAEMLAEEQAKVEKDAGGSE